MFTQVLERALRAERILDWAEVDAATSGARVVATLRVHVAALKAALFKQIPRIIASDGDDVAEGWRSFLGLCTAFNTFDELHLKLSYLGTRWTNSEIEMFIAAVFDEAAGRLGLQVNVSVVPSDTYTFEEINLTASATVQPLPEAVSNEAPTVFLPKSEFDNPLHWASLVHEFGHTLYGARALAADRGPAAEREESTTRRRWSEEVFCDILAAKLLGPAYLASFADFVIATSASDPIESFSETHPDARFRITALLESLRRDDIAARFGEGRELADFFYHLFEDRAAAERRYLRSDIPKLPRLDFNAKEFQHDVIEHIDEILPEQLRARSFTSEHFTRLSDRLKRGIPIGSYNAVDRDVAVPIFDRAESALSALLGQASEDDGGPASTESNATAVDEQLNEMRALVRETPCTVAEILNAGWMYKIESIYLPLIHDLGAFNAEMEATFRDELFRLDGVLRVSIETAYMAREFLAAFGAADAQVMA